MGRGWAKVAAVLVVVLAASCGAFGQGLPQGPPANLPSNGSIIVYLRTQDGESLPDTAVPLIHIAVIGSGTPLPYFATRVAEGWTFANVPGGYVYDIQVTANGYQPGSATVNLPNWQGAVGSVIVFMRPKGDKLAFRPPGGSFILAPKPAKEIQIALQELHAHHIDAAQKHAQKAMKLAPGDPYVQYVMGMTYMVSDQFAQAKPYFEKSVSINPRAPAYLIALGTVRFRMGDNPGAVEALTSAAKLAPKVWKTEWLLAAAYLGEKNYAAARDHARQALKVGKQEARPVELLLGTALAGLGDRPSAASALETFAKEFPSDPNAAKARTWAKTLREPAVPEAMPKPQAQPTAALPVSYQAAPPTLNALESPAVAAPPLEAPPSPDWAPPDVDAAKPFVIATATCPLRQILTRTGKNAEQMIQDLQEFSATEDFQEIELKHGQQLAKPSEEQYDYLVEIDRTSPQAFNVHEIREKDSIAVRLPGAVQPVGAAALALAFHPVIQKDLEWTCEGVGTWDNQPAWVIHFEQKPHAPNVLAWYESASESYPLPLKGRAWVSEGSSQVLHIDTDLVSPVKRIDLQRDHSSIDYKPVRFQQHDVRLWLPAVVNSYVQYEGHFYHYYHRYTDFKLFWVGTTQKISAPKQAQGQSAQPQKQ